MYRNRAVVFALLLIVALASAACSMNRVLPAAADEEAMEVEVRSAIMAVAPGKTMEVDVTAGGHVKLSGHADSADQRTAIVARVKQVNGVRSVDASGIHVQ
ncbi:MAG TPA: BON domain-containing protein [Thermoanaerobaculia bacterium]|nr:BON domain-containing protein [Thermoanaerobaculia bacterium]